MMKSILPLAALLAACTATPEAVTREATAPVPVAVACHARAVAAEEPGGVDDVQIAQQMDRAPGEGWIETPCPLTGGDAAFVASVQRALAARNLYAGEISGRYDASTRAAVAAYQTGMPVEGVVLSMAAAKRLGLVALGRDGV